LIYSLAELRRSLILGTSYARSCVFIIGGSLTPQGA
jgi:hypothetical protein